MYMRQRIKIIQYLSISLIRHLRHLGLTLALPTRRDGLVGLIIIVNAHKIAHFIIRTMNVIWPKARNKMGFLCTLDGVLYCIHTQMENGTRPGLK